jgi:hypothetical protein
MNMPKRKSEKAEGSVRIDDLAPAQWMSPTRRTNGRRLSDREQRAIEAYYAGASLEGIAVSYGLPVAVLADILGLDRLQMAADFARAEAAVSAASDLLQNPIRSDYRREHEDDVLSNPMRRSR